LQILATIHPTGAIRSRHTPHHTMKNLVSNAILFLIPTLTFAAILHDGLTYQASNNSPAVHHAIVIK
jgi:hypothetical protein